MSRLYFWLQNILFHILLLGIVSLIFLLALRYDYSYDITLNKINSLAPASQLIVRQFTTPVSLKILLRPEHKMVPAIDNLLSRYQQQNPTITWEFLDPLLHPDVVTQYQAAMGDTIILHENRAEKIENISEEHITNALQRLLHKKNQKIVFLTGHGEKDIYSQEEDGYYLLHQQLTKQGLEVTTVNLLEERQWPVSMALLVIAGPMDSLVQGEQNKIIQWLEEGGNLLWLQDPLPEKNYLKDLRDYLTLDILTGTIVDNNPDIKDFIGLSKHPALIPVVEGTAHTISQNIKSYVLLPFACGLLPDQMEDSLWRQEVLVQSLDRTWAEQEPLSGTLFLDAADTQGPLDLGVAMQHDNKGKAVVFCDSDFLNNRYIGAGDNLLLGMNSLYWLLEQEAFIDIPAKFSQDKELLLTEQQLIMIAVFFLILLPMLFLVIGALIWWWRKRR